ncbi:hypothetical protein GWI33_003323 [Rhynchophorus ferrugineus]|uniref:Ig-like domain-containing protein n=1 Tax=Rhynchophorus ferrugineus TaxID=354439 RepID=A0A834IXX3_RHYFE|nr:hypothetical protein GWI33_003323 [Rhynchophorus ferrugineus]
MEGGGGSKSDVAHPSDPPEIITKPRNQQVRAGGIAGFYCKARGDPLPQIQWRKNGKKVSSSQTRYQVKEFPDGGALLRIDPVKTGRDDATYECVAENGVADPVSADATLQVFEGKLVASKCNKIIFSFLNRLICGAVVYQGDRLRLDLQSPYLVDF